MNFKFSQSVRIYVKTTELCQLKCKHCYLGQEHPNIKFNPDSTVKWLEQFYNDTKSQIGICLHGGEPLLVDAKIISDFIDEVNSKVPNVSWSVCTNLVYELTDERLELLKKIKEVATSWDGKDIARFGTTAQYELWKKNLDICKKHLDMTIIVSLSKWLINNMSPGEVNDMILEYGAKYFIFERIMGASSLPDLNPSNEMVNEWCKELYTDYITRGRYEYCSNIIFDSMIAANMYGGNPSTYGRDCSSNVLTIHADGSISGCPSALDYTYGTLLDNAETLIKSKARQRFACTEACHNSQCFQCDVFDLCSGGCSLLEWQDQTCLGLPETLRLVREYVNDNKKFYDNVLTFNKYIQEGIKNA